MKNKNLSLWEGVFDSFELSNGDKNVFEETVWINKQKEKINRIIKFENTSIEISKDYPLSQTLALLIGKGQKISVLDFGGGMGIQYLEILKKVPLSKKNLIYYIVEGENLIKNLPKEMLKFSNLNFVSDMTKINENIDIIHIGSSLQYIEDYKNLLSFFNSKFKVKYFIFSDLIAGMIPDFVSNQIFYEKKISVWFFNLEKFKKFMEDLGFFLIFESKFSEKIFGQDKCFPNLGLPKSHQIDRSVNLIFSKK